MENKPAPHTPPAAAALAVLLLPLAVCFAWAARAPNNDLFMVLAGGREVAEGKLNKPDEWSYMTQGRVWINQSWLSDWALYHVWRVSGENGLLAAQAGLIGLMALGFVAWLRARRCSWAAACTSAAVVLSVARVFLTLRGNLVTVVAAPWLLFLLERQRRGSVHWSWLIVLLLAVWTHCHGGFVFGFGVLLLWILTHAPLTAKRLRPLAAGRWLALIGCLAAASALPLVASPFGVRTFGQSLSMASASNEWRQIREWGPLVRTWSPPAKAWSDYKSDLDDNFWEAGPFPALVATMVLLAVVALLVAAGRRRSRPAASEPSMSAVAAPPGKLEPGMQPVDAPPRTLEYAASRVAARRADRSRLLFDAALIGITLVMAFTGRRFVPLATIAVGLPLAWCLDFLWRRGPAGSEAVRVGRSAAFVLLLLCVGLTAANYVALAFGFSRNHPFYPPQTVFARQVMGNHFPEAAARFMRVHGIAGNLMHEYSTECYLYWTVPGVKVFCGGRAQQIYTEKDFTRQRFFQDTRFLLLQQVQLRNKRLFDFDARAILYPTLDLWNLILAFNATRVWLPVFFDGDFVLLIRSVDADGKPRPQFQHFAEGQMKREAVTIIDPASDPDERAAHTAAAGGKLVFPDEATYLYSRAMYLMSPWLTAGSEGLSPQQRAAADEFVFNSRREAIEEAVRVRPHPRLYDLLSILARMRPEPRPDLGPFFIAELERLKKLAVVGADSADLLRCRIDLLDMLKHRAKDAGDDDEAKSFDEQSRRTLEELKRLARWWQTF